MLRSLPGRVIVLIDGEHHPEVVRACLDELRAHGTDVVGGADLGGDEKRAPSVAQLGVEICRGEDPVGALDAALARFSPDVVVDLSDVPIADGATRCLLASRALAAGCEYRGGDFVFTPPPRPRIATKPSIAVIATSKRAGKTAVAGAAARALAARGRAPVIVTMGRGGPTEPEIVEPGSAGLDPHALLERAARGAHAATDHLEDARCAGVTTIGTRRAGGGFGGTPASSSFVAGVRLANARHEPLVIFEGSGAAIPPVHADATICVIPASSDPATALGHLGALRCLLADLVVTTVEAVPPPMGTPGGMSSDVAALQGPLEAALRSIVPGIPVHRTLLRPCPLEPVDGRSVFFATTAPESVAAWQASELASRHGARIVGWTGELARRDRLAGALGSVRADVLVMELKAGAVDVAVRAALDRGMEVVFCDNRPDPPETFDAAIREVADRATERFATPCR